MTNEYTFYTEKDLPTCLAVLNNTRRQAGSRGYVYDAIGGVDGSDNSHVTLVVVDEDYINDKCVQTTKEEALQKHPNLNMLL